MKHLKRFFESTQTHSLSEEDFEDELLEFLDQGYKIEDFESGYYSVELEQFDKTPKNNFRPAYYMWVAKRDDEDNDYEKSRPTLDQLSQTIQTDHQLDDKSISILKAAQKRLNCQFYMDWSRATSFGICALPENSQALEVSQKEQDFHDFEKKVRYTIKQTLWEQDAVTFESQPKDFMIRIKFGNITPNRIATALKNVDILKAGVKGHRRITNTTYQFSKSRVGSNKEWVIEFEKKKG
jgi:hypothetical protein